MGRLKHKPLIPERQTPFDKQDSICYTYDMKKQTQARKAIFVPLEVWQKLKQLADKNNRSLVGQLKEWLK